MNPLFLNPWAILGAGVLAVSLFVGGYLKGHHDAKADGEVQIQALQLEAAESAQKQRQAELIQASNASTGFQNDTAKARIVYKTIHDQIHDILERPVYRNVCLDDDGLRLANAALAGVPTASNPGGPHPIVPAPLAAP